MDDFGDNVDRQLGEWLRDESTTRAPGRVVEGVFAQTTRTRQARRWWPPAMGVGAAGSAPRSLRFAVAVVAIVAVSALALSRIRPFPGVGTHPTPSVSATAEPTPVPPLPSP